MGIKITDSANTYNIALHLLIKKGYILSLQESDDLSILAKKGDKMFSAKDPLTLLSVILIADSKIEVFHETEYIDNITLSAIFIIVSKDYSLIVNNKYSDNWFHWIAIKNTDEFIAQNPIRILALVEIIDGFGENWRNQNIPHYYTDLLKI